MTYQPQPLLVRLAAWLVIILIGAALGRGMVLSTHWGRSHCGTTWSCGHPAEPD